MIVCELDLGGVNWNEKSRTPSFSMLDDIDLVICSPVGLSLSGVRELSLYMKKFFWPFSCLRASISHCKVNTFHFS
jgi:hypothetical protein